MKITTDTQNAIMGDAMDQTHEKYGYEHSDEMWDDFCGESAIWPDHYNWFEGETLETGEIEITSEDDFLSACIKSLGQHLDE